MFYLQKSSVQAVEVIAPPAISLGVHKKLVENTAGTSDQREIPYQMMLCSSIKKGVKQEEKVDVQLGICLSK